MIYFLFCYFVCEIVPFLVKNLQILHRQLFVVLCRYVQIIIPNRCLLVPVMFLVLGNALFYPPGMKYSYNGVCSHFIYLFISYLFSKNFQTISTCWFSILLSWFHNPGFVQMCIMNYFHLCTLIQSSPILLCGPLTSENDC